MRVFVLWVEVIRCVECVIVMKDTLVPSVSVKREEHVCKFTLTDANSEVVLAVSDQPCLQAHSMHAHQCCTLKSEEPFIESYSLRLSVYLCILGPPSQY